MKELKNRSREEQKAAFANMRATGTYRYAEYEDVEKPDPSVKEIQAKQQKERREKKKKEIFEQKQQEAKTRKESPGAIKAIREMKVKEGRGYYYDMSEKRLLTQKEVKEMERDYRPGENKEKYYERRDRIEDTIYISPEDW